MVLSSSKTITRTTIQQMKAFICILISLFLLQLTSAQYPKGTLVVEQFYSQALENKGGENPTRRLTIYLPPGYENDQKRYPVLYYLHGFTWSDSMQIAGDKFDQILDRAIGTGKIKPVIVVMPNQHTLYRGSFYSNSTLTGNWADFTAIDLVKHIDDTYRTIPTKESRGIVGHSMGGSGAIKIGMMFPNVFSCVYGLSPAVLGFVKGWGPSYIGYKRAQEIQSREKLVSGYAEFDANAVVAIGRAFSPNPDLPPFYADLPYSFRNDSLIIHYQTIEKWKAHMPLEMADSYVDKLKQLRAMKLDWGRNEEFQYVVEGCRAFSEKLERLGIEHFAEEYLGKHSDKVWTEDGRALNDMLPFFDRYLRFD